MSYLGCKCILFLLKEQMVTISETTYLWIFSQHIFHYACNEVTISFYTAILEYCTDLSTSGSRQRLQNFFVSFPRLLINANYLTSATWTHNLKFQLKKVHSCISKQYNTEQYKLWTIIIWTIITLSFACFSCVLLRFNYVRSQACSPNVGTFSKGLLVKVSLIF